jgi:hypothetical protein
MRRTRADVPTPRTATFLLHRGVLDVAEAGGTSDASDADQTNMEQTESPDPLEKPPP